MSIKNLFIKLFGAPDVEPGPTEEEHINMQAMGNFDDNPSQSAVPVVSRVYSLPVNTNTGPIEDRVAISKEQLSELDNFVRDADFKSEDIPRWKIGHKLQKSGAILVGTFSPFKPKYKVRFNIFAKNAFKAVEGDDDPWKLGAIDRDAFFTIADVYDHGDVVQFTLVEIDEACSTCEQTYILDNEAKEQVRNSLIDSYFQAIPSYANDPLYKELMGNEAVKHRPDAFWEIDKPKSGLGPVESSLKSNDPRIEILQRVKKEDEEYCLFMELEERKGNTPDIYRQIYIARISDDELRVIGIGQALMACLCDSFIANCHIREEMTEHILKITNKARLASGNINLPKEGSKPKRIASWVKDPEGKIKVNYLEGYELHKTEFVDFYELLLYLFVHVAYPYATRKELLKARRNDVFRLNDQIPYCELKLTNRLSRIQAEKKAENAHPSLEFIESRINARKIQHFALESRAIKELYEGNRIPTYPVVKDLILEDIWLNPFRGAWFDAMLSGGEKEVIDTIEEMKSEATSSEDVEKLCIIADEYKKLFEGDIRTSIERIRRNIESLLLPYRYTFSMTFDEELRQIRLNLFLPEAELFPTFTVKNHDPWSYKPTILDATSRRRKYAEFFTRLCMLTLTLVKSSAPWYTSLAINAWMHYEGEWRCVGAGEFPEARICSLTEVDQLNVSARMRSIGLTFDKSKDGRLNAVKPCFEMENGNDFRFGFALLDEDILIPEWSPVVKGDGSSQDLDIAIKRVEDISEPGVQVNIDLKEMRAIVEACYKKAMADIQDGQKIFSCSCDMEEALLKRDPNMDNAVFLKADLSRAYAIIGSALIEKGESEEAYENLIRAVGLNPANYLALHELVAISVMNEDWEKARSILAQCSKYAFTNEMLSFVLRQYGFASVEEGDIDTAKDLFICALGVDSSSQNVDYCMRELAGIGFFDELDSFPFDLDMEKARENAISAGYMVKLDSCIQEIVLSFTRKMGMGKGYPDQSVGEAMLSLMVDRKIVDEEPFSIEDVSKMFECVLGAKLGVCPIFDYVFEPVVIPSKEMRLPVLESIGATDTEAAILCIPYIDNKIGLRLYVVALVDSNGFGFKEALQKPLSIGVRSCMNEYLSAYLRDYSDYPEMNLLDICKELAAKNLPTEGVDRTRAVRATDDLRDFERPDNILVVLRGGGQAPEAMWAEAVDVIGEEVLVRLLSAPYDDFGVMQGGVYPIALEEHPDTDKLIAYIDCDRFV